MTRHHPLTEIVMNRYDSANHSRDGRFVLNAPEFRTSLDAVFAALPETRECAAQVEPCINCGADLASRPFCPVCGMTYIEADYSFEQRPIGSIPASV